MAKKRVLLLGSTGSIGVSTDEVVQNLSDELVLVALAAHSRWESLLEQTRRHRPEAVALTDADAYEKFRAAIDADTDFSESSTGQPRPRLYQGAQGLVDMVRETDGEILVAAISGAAGLPANLAALETGKDLALANKESLVMSGSILTRLAKEKGREILPVDSEHNAIFQSLRTGKHDEVRSIILTASGGPFRNSTHEELAAVTKAQALNHPTWDMGAKITIDSATLMNKALEVIEARWLFDMPPSMIDVVIHPQSMIHSLVEYQDGSTICQLGPPDMKVPIQYALTFPDRRPLPVERLNLAQIGQLTFQAPDPGRFPAIRLAYEVLEKGGTAATVFNAANEVAVAAFLREEIPFLAILKTVEQCLDAHELIADPSLDEIFATDAWARNESERILSTVRKETA